jgi:hypothetical protein
MRFEVLNGTPAMLCRRQPYEYPLKRLGFLINRGIERYKGGLYCLEKSKAICHIII